MEKQPLVSVILPTYKRGERLKKAIESVLSQTYKNLELIIIDDTPDDSISNLISEIKDSRIIYIQNKERLGFVKSLNKGVSLAKGKYVARIDADDFWYNDKKLGKQIEFLENHSDYVLCGGGVIITDEKGKEMVMFLHPKKDEDIRKTILFLGNFAHSSIVFRKDTYDLVGGYDECLDYCEDRDLWLKLGKVGKFYNFQDYFIKYLQSEKSRSNRRKEIKIGNELRKKYRNDYPNFYKATIFSYFYSFYCFFLRKLLYSASPKLREISFNILTFSSKSLLKKNFKKLLKKIIINKQ